MINWMSDEVSEEVTRALAKGSKQLKKAQAIRERIDANANEKVQKEAIDA